MTAETTDRLAELLPAEDIAVLNRARSVLGGLMARAGAYGTDAIVDPPPVLSGTPDARDYGIVQAYAERAEEALFQVLNRGRHHAKVDMTDDQLHNREPVVRVRVIDTTTGADVSDQYVVGPLRSAETHCVGDGREPFQGDSPGEHDWRL